MTATELNGKIALVTGGSRGLGRAICHGLAAAGATVVVSSRKQEACDLVAREITDRAGRPAYAAAMHVGRWDEVEHVLDRIEAEVGPIGVLVNNAGIAPVAPSLAEQTEALFDKTIEINLKGPFRLMALVGQRMQEHGGGSIINISSIGSLRPSNTEATYAAAKAGLNALTMAFSQEYAPTVRVNAVLPGSFATDMASEWTEEFVSMVVEGMPANRVGRPEELVSAVRYFASDSSSYTTGALLNVDGGRTAVY